MKKRTLVCFLIFTLCIFHNSIPDTAFGQEAEVSLAQQMLKKYSALLMREDIQEVLPEVLKGLKDPAIQPLLNQQTITLVVENPDLLATFVQGIDPRFITLLKEDAQLKAMLSDPLVQGLLQNPAAIDEAEKLLQAGVIAPPVVETPVVTPPVVTPPVVTPPVVTPPVVETPVVQANPFGQLVPANDSLIGRSRLGGLELNKLSAARFLDELFGAIGLPIEAFRGQELLVDSILELIPKGYLPKKQIRQLLSSKDIRSFADQAGEQGLDRENFGNAIMPMLSEVVFTDTPNRTYLTSNNLNVYTRVPSADIGGVEFALTNGQTVAGTQLTPKIFGADTFYYTFRLEEALAATNLPAWPALKSQLFSSVVLRYSQTGLNGDYIAVDMQPTNTAKGVVWEMEIGVTPGSTYYYYEVTLVEPLAFEILDRQVVNDLLKKVVDGNTVQLADVFSATKSYTIEKWAMPDPRNLQLADRGLLEQLFTPNLQAVIGEVIGELIGELDLQGGALTLKPVLDALGKHRAKLNNILLRNTEQIVMQFESAFDPMLASVFTIPDIKPETESIWAANIDSIADGNYYLKATVYDKAGNPLDQMQGEFTVDTNAPEAMLQITPGDNAGGYLNEEGIYIATAPAPGAATLNVSAGQIAGIAPGEGYLVFQEVKLDTDGMPQSTWMPLTIDATLVASPLWDAVRTQLETQDLLKGNLKFVKGLSLDAILGLLTPGLIQTYANPFLKSLEPFLESFIGPLQLNEAQSKMLHNVLGPSVDLINAIPVTFGVPHNTVTMPIQGEQLPLLVGDYGVRAMGIDGLFNVSSHTEPTRIRIVAPVYDSAKVVSVVIGDYNRDGDTDDAYESGAVEDITIFANTTENVVLTIQVTGRTIHPAGVVVQYMDATGAWRNIGELDLAGSEVNSTLEVNWNITDFDALVGAGDSVMVRAVASNALGLSDREPVVAKIALDAGIFPLPVEVSALTVEPPETTNVDSGGPTGFLTVNGYTPERTTPDIVAVRFEVKRSGDKEWIDVGTAKKSTAVIPQGDERISILDDLTGAAIGGKPVVAVAKNYMKWALSVDTTKLEDTITAESPAARDASKDANQYTVRAFAIASDGSETVSALGVTAKLSVDNVDDVGPVGPTLILLVEDAAGLIAPDENGIYTVGGIVDDTVEAPIATFTIQPTAVKSTYSSVKLVQTASDGTVTEITAEAGSLKVTVELSKLENAAYSFHALAVDSLGNVQTDKSPATDVNVVNFRVSDISGMGVTAVDGEAVSESPTAPIPLKKSITVGFTVANGSLNLGDLTGSTLNGKEIPSESAEEPENTFSITVDFSGLRDGFYTPNGVVTKRNGSISFALSEAKALVNLDNTAPMITIVTPSAGDTVDSLPTVHAKYDDGMGSGVDAVTGSLGLVRILPPDEIPVDVEQAMLEKDADKLVYTRKEQLLGGAYRVVIKIADMLGNVGEASAEFAISGTIPTVVIHSPAAGQTFEHGKPLISGEFSGAGILELTSFTVDGNDATAALDGTHFSYTPADALVDGEHTVAVEVTDGNGKTAKASVIFTVAIPVEPEDTTPPVITEASPSGLIKDYSLVTISAVVIDEQSAISSVQFGIDDKPLRSVPLEDIAKGRIQISDTFTPGTHRLKVIAVSEGGSTEYSWTFTLVETLEDTTPPVITEASPSGLIQDYSLVTISAVVIDEQSAISSVQFGIDDEPLRSVPLEDIAEGRMQISDTFTPGTHRLKVIAVSEGGSTEHSWTFTLAVKPEDTTPPVITEASPSGLIKDYSLVTISAVVIDEQSAISSVQFGIDDEPLRSVPLEDIAEGRIQISDTFTPGTHTLKVIAVSEGGSTEYSWTFTLVETLEDTTPPVITEASPSGLIQDYSLVTISAVVIDEQSAISSVQFGIDDEPLRSVPLEDIAEGRMQISDTFTPGTHRLKVIAVSEGGSTEHSWTFTLAVKPEDTTPPVITEASPSGLIKGDSWVTISAVVIDEQSAISSVRFGIDDKPLRSVPLAQIAEGRIQISDSFTPGTHTLKVIALSEGGSTEYSWTFTLVVDNVSPTITSITPSGTFRGGLPAISASANDESGIDDMSIVLIDSDGKEVKGSDEDDGEDNVAGITRIDFVPEAPLSEGTYTIEVRATDTIGNSATAKGNFTIDFDTAAPVITMSSPQQDARLTERRPTISISFADAESGVDADSIRLVVDDQLINLAPNQKSASQVIYVPPTELSVGIHTVKLEVSDMAHQEGNVSEKSKDARKVNMAVHEFSFVVEEEEGPVLAARPINAPNPFKENTRISFTLNRQSTVSIVIYDITLRPVRVLVDNEVWDAGEYIGRNAIGWDGTTTGGEDLARGIYFCQITVADGFEPEYAILKLALTR